MLHRKNLILFPFRCVPLSGMLFSHVLSESTGSRHLVLAHLTAKLLIEMLYSDMTLQVVTAPNLVVALVTLEQPGRVALGHVTSQLSGTTGGDKVALATNPLAALVSLALVPPQAVRNFATKITLIAEEFQALVLGLNMHLE